MYQCSKYVLIEINEHYDETRQGSSLTCIFHLVMVHHGQGLHGIIDWFPLQQTWSTTITGSSTTWWSQEPTGQNYNMPSPYCLCRAETLMLCHLSFKCLSTLCLESVCVCVCVRECSCMHGASKQMTIGRIKAAYSFLWTFWRWRGTWHRSPHRSVKQTPTVRYSRHSSSHLKTISSVGYQSLKTLYLTTHVTTQQATTRCCLTDLRKDLWGDVWLGVEEVQHVARMLDAVFGRLFWGGEPVVSGAVEVLETTCAIF